MNTHINNHDLLFFDGDINDYYYNFVLESKIVTCDIETSGLNWKEDAIALCQLYSVNAPVAIVKIRNITPVNICKIMENNRIKKIFHHAMFDLRFMASKWGVMPKNIICTKIASKLLNKEFSHSLKDLIHKHLGISIDKSLQRSDWTTSQLTNNQISYATNDVVHLFKLSAILNSELKKTKKYVLAKQCYMHIPTRVYLDILEYSDIYTY